jgi:hypothetical protein
MIPETPSHFISHTKLLPEQSDSTKTDFPFQEYIPIACFCDRSKCNAYVQSIESPIIGLLTRDGKFVKSLDIEVNKGELMYIILIDGLSNLTDDTYLERTSYWHLTDGQQQVLAGVPVDLEILRQVSISILKANSQQFTIETETKSIVINALEMSTGLSILPMEDSESKTTYRYPASQFSQVVGVYQLFHELTMHPGVSLKNYIESQKTGAQCSSYIIFKAKCGFLQLFPSFLQRTSVFRQVAVSLTAEDSLSGSTDENSEITENNQKPNKKGLSGKTIAIIIFVSIVCILLAGSIAALWHYGVRIVRYVLSGQKPIPQEDPDDNHELVAMPQKQTEQVLPLI